MRRRDRRRDGRGATRTERCLLHMYWALSGYGLRASRAFCWLTVMATATVLALMLWGLPNSDPKPQVTGTQPRPATKWPSSSIPRTRSCTVP